MTAASLILTRARLWRAGARADAHELVNLRVEKGRLVSITPCVAGVGQEHSASLSIDLDGRWLMPGLVDRHVHFTLWSKHRHRVDVGGLGSAADVVRALVAALVDTEADARPQGDGVRSRASGKTARVAPLIARGFQDALWPDTPTAQMLDDAAARVGQPHRPMVVISHDLHCVWINTAAAARYHAQPGLLREDAAFDLEIALEAEEAADVRRVETLVADAAAAAAARGVTGIMDLEMADNPAVWAARVGEGLRSLRVEAGVYPHHLEQVLARTERTGRRLSGTSGLVTVGPLKVFADGSLNTRTAWCDAPYPRSASFGHAVHPRGDLVKILADAREVGFEVALHAIGDRAVAEALDAFAQSGARGSIEHAQLVRDEDIGRFAALGVAAGIHPEHALDDRRVSDRLWEGRTRRAFPYRALATAGVRLRMGSDAPVSPLDPWLGISAAVHRTRDDQPPWEPGNALSLDQALRATWASPSVSVGMLADLVAIDNDPAGLTSAALRHMKVALTVVAGRVTHQAMT